MEVFHGDADTVKESADFWQYFFLRGFGYRHRRVRGQWEEDYIYVKDGECYLPAYVDYMFSPSRAWQRAFVGWDEETESIALPVSATNFVSVTPSISVLFPFLGRGKVSTL